MNGMCWICRGHGYVRGPLYAAPCPVPECPHRRMTAASTTRRRRQRLDALHRAREERSAVAR